MGICIVGYRNITKTAIPIDYDAGGYVTERAGHTWFDRGVSDAYDERHERKYGIRPGYFDGLDDGFYYAVADEDVVVGFSVAYSTYGAFRTLIEDYVRDEAKDEGLFREMTEFSDCCGTFGPKVVGKLLADFHGAHDGFFAYADRELGGYEGWCDAETIKGLYDGYVEALEAATEGGALAYE